VIFGDYAGDQVLASALGLPRPGPGEFVSARLVPRRDAHRAGEHGTGEHEGGEHGTGEHEGGEHGTGEHEGGEHGTGEHEDYARSIRLAGADWLLASAADPPSPAPALPRWPQTCSR